MSLLSKRRLLAVVTAVATFAALSAGPALADQTGVTPTKAAHAVKPGAIAPVTVPLVSSGSNSLCVNPVGTTWGDGASPPSTLATNFSNANGNCDPPAALASQNTAIAQGTPGTDPCGYGAVVPPADGTSASWVGIDPNHDCSDSLNPPGGSPNPNRYYIYDTEFSLPACALNVSISGNMLADNAAAAYLNQYLIGSQSSLNGGPTTNFDQAPGTAFSSTDQSDFEFGTTNVLDFLVLDHTTPKTGLDFSATLTYTPCGTLKICKVAGFGVQVGQHVKFTMTPAPSSGTRTVSVPAGPAPGGYCVVAGTFAQDSDVTLAESIPSGDSVASIGVTPASAELGSPNLGTGTVQVAIGPGVTEATYTNVNNTAEENSGYFEICKQTVVASPWEHLIGTIPTFKFTVGGQDIDGVRTQSQTVNVPGGACSPPIQVLAGSVTVTENLTKTWNMVNCSVANSGTLTACNLAAASATLTVPAGGISNESLLTITNSGYSPVGPANPCDNCIVAFSGSVSLGYSNIVTGTVVGTATAGSPTGTMSFYECGPTAKAQACTSTGNPLGSPITLTAGTKDTATATTASFWPSAAGYWCTGEYYSGDSNYPASSDTSTDGCFDVTSTTPQITTVTIPSAQAGVAYSMKLAATGGTAPYKWSATGLPKGFTLNAKTGLLTGKPTTTQAGVYSLGVTVSDSSKPAKSTTATLTLLVASPPSITSASTTTFTIDTPGAFTVTTAGFPEPALSESGALPSGVTFTDNGNGTASLAGTPTTGVGESFPITITADNSVGTNATQSFTLDVAPTTTNCTIVPDPTPTDYTDCPGADLSGDDLGNVDLNYANLAGADLYGSILTGATLEDADLAGINVSGASAEQANYSGANLTDAVLSGGGNFDQSEFANANLTGVIMGGGFDLDDFTDANLTQANMSAGSFDSADIFSGTTWSDTTCPDGTNSDSDGGTCVNDLS